MNSTDLHTAWSLATGALSTLDFLPQTHISALSAYAACLAPPSTSPYTTFHHAFLSIHTTIMAMLLSLSRPTSLIASITTSRRAIERNYSSLSRSTRWPLGLLDETRQRLNEEKEDKVRKGKEEAEELGRELRYTQQVVAGELAGWQESHGRMGRVAVRELARSVLVVERGRLEGLRRALRKLRLEPVVMPLVATENASAMSAGVEIVDGGGVGEVGGGGGGNGDAGEGSSSSSL